MVEFLPAASEEMILAAEWYETRRTGTGIRFLSEIARYTDILRQHPGVGTILADRRGREVRAMMMSAFPYLIVYRETPNILVIAVAHTSRRPGFWRSR